MGREVAAGPPGAEVMDERDADRVVAAQFPWWGANDQSLWPDVSEAERSQAAQTYIGLVYGRAEGEEEMGGGEPIAEVLWDIANGKKRGDKDALIAYETLEPILRERVDRMGQAGEPVQAASVGFTPEQSAAMFTPGTAGSNWDRIAEIEAELQQLRMTTNPMGNPRYAALESELRERRQSRGF